MPSSSQHHHSRPLDALAASIVVVLCLSWGFNQVATKLAIHDIPPLLQAAIRSAAATLIVALWCKARGIALFARDGTLLAGLAAGLLFGGEFILIFQGLVYTTASRATLFIYLAPFFVVLGARLVLPSDRFSPAQWLGLALSFAGMLLAFGLPTPALDPRQAIGDVMMVAAALLWAATTLVIKASALNRVAAEKVLLYQLVVSAPMMALAALIAGERITHWPSALALGALGYQTFWVVSVTFAIWFALIARFSASRLSAFTFLTPLFGVAAGHLVLSEPLSGAFAAAVALVAGGLILVNRARGC
ncbi:MAG TPA: DMT family transporter [Pseudolabrys sp.]|nr:DMT family transporter [Pseudolabrys sp.]